MVGEPTSDQQPEQPGDAGSDHHGGRHDAGLVEDVLRVEEDEAIRRSGDDRHGKGQEGDYDQSSTERWADRAKHRERLLGGRRRNGEPVWLLDPPS